MLLRSLFFLLAVQAFSAETIYGVMITGKDAIRERFAKLSIENFFGQTYPEKKLIIINHSPDYSFAHLDPRIIEVRTEKQILGKMRNIALSHVPDDSLFVNWDDDDWRYEGMVSGLYDHLQKRRGADCVSMSSRIEYVFKNNYAFYLKRHSMSGLILCRKKSDVLYAEESIGEDWHYLRAYRKKYRVVNYRNPAHWYLRFQHGSNVTYPRWKSNRDGNDNVWDISAEDKKYLKNALKKYRWVYKTGVR